MKAPPAFELFNSNPTTIMFEHDAISAGVRRSLRTADRFDNYREISAKFDSVGKCGHPIKKGDTIGYNRQHGCQCANCWAKWRAENAAAAADEAMMSSGYGYGGGW